MQSKKRWIIKFTNLLTTGLILFSASGTFEWLMAWLYMTFMITYIIMSGRFTHSELHIVQSMRVDGTKKWDLVTAPFVMILGPLLMLLTAGLDKRFEWSNIPLFIQVIACLFLLIGACIALWAKKANNFYSETVRIQYERHHVVISDGPYRYVRHPGYMGYIIVSIAAPLMFGSLYAMIPSIFIILGYIARTILEDVTLQRQFKGYYDYTKKVPYRLLPGIW